MNTLKYLALPMVVIFCSRAVANESADRKACISQIKKLGELSVNFASANRGRLPKSFDELLSAQKTPEPSLLVAPPASDRRKPSFELLSPAEKLSGIVNPSRTIVIRSLYSLKDGRRLAAFADGHVEILDANP